MSVMNTERTLYREWSPAPTFMTVILWGVVGMMIYAVVTEASDVRVSGMRLLATSSVAAFVALIWALLFGLTVRVQETRIALHLGRTPLVRTVVPFTDIVSIRVVRYRPLGEFGGWGVRGSRQRRAWAARGDQAVEVTLIGDRVLLIGSDHPQRLENAILTHGGPGITRTAGRA
jgi:hypothetical protein